MKSPRSKISQFKQASKNGGTVYPFSQNANPSSWHQFIYFLNKKLPKKEAHPAVCQTVGCGQRPTIAWWLRPGALNSPILAKVFFLLPSLWSTLVGWLQHMPTPPKLLLKTSNTHNFWSVGSKIMKFVLIQSLWQDASSQKSFKKSKNKMKWHCPKPVWSLHVHSVL
jgi:hypothetical protein